MKVKIDKFIVAIIGVVTLAYLFPNWGSKESPIPHELIGSIGISFIFFFYGLKLNTEKLKANLKNWKLHILIQSTTFIVFPALVLLFYPFISSDKGETMWLAFFFLAALPSTVSSSVVMVSIAKGNIPASIFNASISGLIGITVTPLWMGFFLKQESSDFSLQSVYLKLLIEILLPVVVGLILQRYWGKFATKYSKQLSLFDKGVILLIIFKSFGQSFKDEVFTSVDLQDFILIAVGVVLLFYAIYFYTGSMSKRLKFSLEDKITAQFCGTKKSLVHGTVFSKILFAGFHSPGLVLLPLMLFHAFQIFTVSLIASKLVKREIK